MDFWQLVFQYITQGGEAAIIVILLGINVLLVWDRKQILKTLGDTTQKVYDAKDSETESIKEIIEKYHQGHLSVVQALNEIRIVLVSIQNSKR